MPIEIHEKYLQTPLGKLFVKSWAADDAAAQVNAPIILLHDSLGCVALWRDFPEQLARATSRQVIAYDRLGFGRSDPHPGRLSVGSFIEDEAKEGFQIVREQMGIRRFIALGHSVGGGMAIGCAASDQASCAGVITLSAQAFADPDTLEAIRIAKVQFAHPEQIDRLKKYHGEKAAWVVDAWVNSWLSDDFGEWCLDPQSSQVQCPALILHGEQDEYGSREHPLRIAKRIPGQTDLNILPKCGHMPHREYPDEVLSLISEFLIQSI